MKDPSGKELHAAALKAMNELGGEREDKPDALEAAYWFAHDNHGGQNSNLYAAMCASPYKPGFSTSGCEKGGLAERIYNELCIRFNGVDALGVQAWENRSRAAFAMRALKAYAEAKGEIADEGDITMLMADMTHLLREIYFNHAKGAEEWARVRMKSMSEQAGDFFNDDVESVGKYERGNVAMSAELQEELLLFLEDQDKEKRTKLEKPLGVD